MRFVGQLEIPDLSTAEIKGYKQIADSGDNVYSETANAIRIEYSFTRKQVWIPKSVCRLGHDKSLWVAQWFYEKNLSP